MAFVACKKESGGSSGSKEDTKTINLDNNVDGANLTKEFCVDLVQNYWDCGKGAGVCWGRSDGGWGCYKVGCESGGRGDVLIKIEDSFDEITREESYYRYRILQLVFDSENCRLTLTIYF